jgi:uncharacterized lipoprotein YddW (UPF0748 family)
MQPTGEMVIDGKLDEWGNTPQTAEFVDISGRDELKPYLKTVAMMMWDSSYLYIAAEMEEPHLWATIRERDKVIYYDNDFEVFIDPDGDTHNYAEIELNAFNTVWDLFLTRPYRDGTTPLNSFDVNGLKSEIRLVGSINDPSDIDTGWVLEMAIPWKALAELTPGNRKPYPGEYWRINFSRVQWELDIENGKYVKANLPEHNWVWSPQGKVDMHMPEKWGYVFFSDQNARKDAAIPQIPREEHIRHLLRELYFAQKAYYREHKEYSADIDGFDTNFLPNQQYPGNIELKASGGQFLAGYHDPNEYSIFINQHGKIWKEKDLKAWVWMHGNAELNDSVWDARLGNLYDNGIEGVLLGGGDEVLRRVIKIAEKYGIEIHAWRWMLNCNNKEIIEQHPEWYSVSREGYSCLEKQPYVGYYKWLCPSREGVREYLNARVRETMNIEGLAGFHMDYIRYPDVILPRALWEKYGLYQDHEMPEYDYCYCEVCRSKFKDQYGYDPLELENPEQDSLWRQFRYDIVTEVVNGIEDDIMLTAAVFPSPYIARTLVRQEWDKWQTVRMFFPMVYHNFYNEDLQWIGETTWAGVYAIRNRVPVYTGLYVPSLTPTELGKAIRIAIDGGASGVSLFEYGAMTDEHWNAFRNAVSKFR